MEDWEDIHGDGKFELVGVGLEYLSDSVESQSFPAQLVGGLFGLEIFGGESNFVANLVVWRGA